MILSRIRWHRANYLKPILHAIGAASLIKWQDLLAGAAYILEAAAAHLCIR
jgi:hypothetical protein